MKKKKQNEDLGKINRNSNKTNNTVSVHIPKMFRRKERSRKNRGLKRRNDGEVVGTMGFWSGGRLFFNNPRSNNFYPRRKKIKGWQRENLKYRKAS